MLQNMKRLVWRGKCVIFTNPKSSGGRQLVLTSMNTSCANSGLMRRLRETCCVVAPNPVTGLWTGCTRLKTRVLTNA